MRIERIAKNTINVYISQNDLATRNLSFSTLKEDSADYTKLVWDAIDHANIEFGREFDDRQLKIVNKFDADGYLVLTISHNIDDLSENDNYNEAAFEEENPLLKHFDNILNAAADSMRKELGIEQRDNKKDSSYSKENNNSNNNFRTIFSKMHSNPEQKSNTQPIVNEVPDNNEQIQQEIPEESKNPLLPDWDIIVFPVFTDMVEFFSKNQNFKKIASSLYGYRGAYYLLLKPNSKNTGTVSKLESMVVDYNATYLPADSFLPLLIERGNVIIEKGAISKIIKYFAN